MVNDISTSYEFDSRRAFRIWLEKNHKTSDGIWVILKKGSKHFSANDGLEEAICFGWIDGVMKSIDEYTYKKYYSRRKNRENWSEKNIKIFEKLKEAKLLTKSGIDAFSPNSIESKTTRAEQSNKNIHILKQALAPDTEVLGIFENKPPSRQKQYAGFYCDAKTEETRMKRKRKITEALKSGYEGMLY